MRARFDKALETHQKQRGPGAWVSLASRKSASRLLGEVKRYIPSDTPFSSYAEEFGRNGQTSKLQWTLTA